MSRYNGLRIVGEYYDAAVSGCDPANALPVSNRCSQPSMGGDVRTIVVEDATRFARDVIEQEMGLRLLIKRSVTVLTASGWNLTDNSDASRAAMRQCSACLPSMSANRWWRNCAVRETGQARLLGGA